MVMLDETSIVVSCTGIFVLNQLTSGKYWKCPTEAVKTEKVNLRLPELKSLEDGRLT